VRKWDCAKDVIRW